MLDNDGTVPAVDVTGGETGDDDGPQKSQRQSEAEAIADAAAGMADGELVTDQTIAEWAGREKPGKGATWRAGREYELWRLGALDAANMILLTRIGRRLVNRGRQTYELIPPGAVSAQEESTFYESVCGRCVKALLRINAQRPDVLTADERRDANDARARIGTAAAAAQTYRRMQREKELPAPEAEPEAGADG